MICLHSLHCLDQLEFDLPFLISSLVSKDRQLSSVVAGHVQWLEKFLGELEKYIIKEEKAAVKKDGKKAVIKENKYIYNNLMWPWEYNFRYICTVHVYSPYTYAHRVYIDVHVYVHMYIYIIQCSLLFRPVAVEDLRLENGPHNLVPGPYLRQTVYANQFLTEGEPLRHLLHYTNYFYPVTLDDHVSKKTTSSPLSSPLIHPMQRVAIDRVNYWIKTR